MENMPPEEDRFMTNVLDLTELVHELATICWDSGKKDINPSLIAMAEGYIESYDHVELIEIFIKHSHHHWDAIRKRDEVFFIENAHEIFKYLPVDTNNINAFKIFFTAKDDNNEHIIDVEDRNAIWEMFDSLVKICIKYIHRVRGVKLVKTSKGMRPAYKDKTKFPEIKVREHARKWGITLEIPKY